MHAHPWIARRALVVTKHGKEHAVGPLLRRAFRLSVEVLPVDTDRFGTFTGTVAREGSARDALERKLREGVAHAEPGEVVVASEGSFSSDFFGTSDIELVGLLEVGRPAPVIGSIHAYHTRAASVQIATDVDLDRALTSIGVPAFGAIVRTAESVAATGMHDGAAIRALVERLRREGEAVTVESDLRAFHHPQRMRTIARACAAAIRRACVRCPGCNIPGFGLTGRIGGAPCEACAFPTALPRAERLSCAVCGYASTRETGIVAPAGRCDRCNP